MSENAPDISPGNPHPPRRGHDIRRIIYLLATTLLGVFVVGIALEKWGGDFPDWAFILLCVITLCLFLYWIWTAEAIKKHHRLIYSYPKMTLAILILVGACLGGGIGWLLWWSVYKQQASAPSLEQKEITPQTSQAVTQPTPTPSPLPVASPPLTAKDIAAEVRKELQALGVQAGQMQSGLRKLLIPANDPTPPNLCDNYPRPIDRKALKLVLLGPAATLYAHREKPISLISIKGESVLGIERAPGGVVLNATIKDETGRLIATITKNVYKPYAPNDYEVRSDDHSVLILNSKDQVVLFVRYLNPNALKVLGIFNVANHPTVTVEEGRILVGNKPDGMRLKICGVDDAPEGDWAQMKSMFEF